MRIENSIGVGIYLLDGVRLTITAGSHGRFIPFVVEITLYMYNRSFVVVFPLSGRS